MVMGMTGESVEMTHPNVRMRVRQGEQIRDALRRFRRICDRAGLRKSIRRMEFYRKPSVQRRLDHLKRIRRARKTTTVSSDQKRSPR